MVKINRYANFTYDQWLEKARKYCAGRERCSNDVQQHLERGDCPQSTIDMILESLTEEGFLSDLRYAVQFAQSKISKKAWGELKIRHALSARRISRETIEEALERLHGEGERPDLYGLIEGKLAVSDVRPNDTMLCARLLRFAYSRGFNPEEAQQVVRQVLRDKGYMSTQVVA